MSTLRFAIVTNAGELLAAVSGCTEEIEIPEEAVEPPKKRFPRTQYRKGGLCTFPSCDQKGSHPHHVVYVPKPCVFRLCPQHHRDITTCNINASELNHRKLSNRHRWLIWTKWLKGEIKPIETDRSKEWLASWRD